MPREEETLWRWRGGGGRGGGGGGRGGVPLAAAVTPVPSPPGVGLGDDGQVAAEALQGAPHDVLGDGRRGGKGWW